MRAGLIQTSASENLQENLKRTASLLQEAAEQGAELVCLQECFNTWSALTHGFSRNVSILMIKH